MDVETVEEWGGDLRVIAVRLRRRFARVAGSKRAIAYIRGLLSDIPRKNGWQLAEQAGEGTPDGMQRLLGSSVWDEAGVRDDLAEYILEPVGEPEAVLGADETGFLKPGEHSAGVKRQYSGTAGRIANCQIGVFVAYASRRGHVWLDRRLYLPREGMQDNTRGQEAGIPDEVGFATKPDLARQMMEVALAQGAPFGWVSGDSLYGADRSWRLWLETHHLPFVLGVAQDEPLWCEFRQRRADSLAEDIRPADWQRLRCGDGAKGPRVYAWAVVILRRSLQEKNVRHALLVRRSISNGELAYYVVFAPSDTVLQTLVNVAGQRWKVEACFELAKDEVGLNHDEVRRWTAWYRQSTLAMWALAYLTVTAAQAKELDAQKKAPPHLATPTPTCQCV